MQTETPLADLIEDLNACIDCDTVPVVVGPAGVGKTATAVSLFRKRGYQTEVMIGSAMDPTDVTGVPWVERDNPYRDARGRDHHRIVYAQQRKLLYLNECAERDGGAGLILDEFTCVGPSIQAPLLRVINEREAGDLKLHPNLSIVVLMNPAEEAVNGQELAGPMNNRIEHYDYPVTPASVTEWCANYTGYWGLAPQIRYITQESLVRARAAIAGFISRFPQYWLSKPSEGKPLPRAYCSPRSWDRCSRYLARCFDRGLRPIQCMRQVAAAIGIENALAFQDVLSNDELPDPEKLLANPDLFKPTGRVDLDYAITLGVVGAFESKKDMHRFVAAWKILNKAVDNKGGSTPAYEAGMAAAVQLSPYAIGAKMAEIAKNTKAEVGVLTKLGNEVTKLSQPFHGMLKNMGTLA